MYILQNWIWDEFWQRQTVVSIHKLIISIIVQESNGEFICRVSSKKNVTSDLNGKWTDKGLQKCSAVWQQCRQIWFFDPLWNHNVLLKKNHIIYHIFTCYYALMTIQWWFAICALIEIWWMNLKIIGTYTTSSLVHHFKSIPKWPIWVKFDDFFSRVTLKLDDWPWKTIGHLSLVTSISGYCKLF